ncbi:hypothetical protein E2C01_023977 [Portunus trituberculatus]|uniref:Uncharacterized protein n=1 Tax=Portunus trituberculatus TaxID=210409 RepID=A0A5B7EBE0_PORTR|nr:hypothetical protein [Portunus trituberculatus]
MPRKTTTCSYKQPTCLEGAGTGPASRKCSTYKGRLRGKANGCYLYSRRGQSDKDGSAGVFLRRSAVHGGRASRRQHHDQTPAVNLGHRIITVDVSILACSARELGGSWVTGASGGGIWEGCEARPEIRAGGVSWLLDVSSSSITLLSL